MPTTTAAVIPADVDVHYHDRDFSLIRGRKWTRVPERMSNGQRTARFFVNESTREVRLARSWKSPMPTPICGDAAAYVLAIVDQGRA